MSMAPVVSLGPAVSARRARPGPGGRPPGAAFPGRNGGGALLAVHAWGPGAAGEGSTLEIVSSGGKRAAQ